MLFKYSDYPTINVDLMEGNRKRKSFDSEDESPSLKYRRLDDVVEHQARGEEVECAAGSSASLPAETIMQDVNTTSNDSDDVRFQCIFDKSS